MSEVHAVKILKTACGILQLWPDSVEGCATRNVVPTSLNGLAWAFSLKNLTMFPFFIHGKTMAHSVLLIVTPIRPNTLG